MELMICPVYPKLSKHQQWACMKRCYHHREHHRGDGCYSRCAVHAGISGSSHCIVINSSISIHNMRNSVLGLPEGEQ